MALQFTLSQQVARLWSCCPAAVRGRVVRELSQTLSGASPRRRPTPHQGPEVGVLRLPCGVQVSYRLDHARQWVEVLDLAAQGGLHLAPASL